MDAIQDATSALSVNVTLSIDFRESNVTTKPLRQRGKYVDDTTALYFKMLVYCALCGLISIVGIVTNITNIIVFLRQGVLSESNIFCLFSLAVSDLFCTVLMLWFSTGLALSLVDLPGLRWDPVSVMYATAAWPRLMFAQITRMVTAYVAFERCVCVVFPFKVRTWLTAKRSVYVIVTIFMFCFVDFCPMFATQPLRFRTDPRTNFTRLVLTFTQNRYFILNIFFQISTVVNFVSVGIVLLCTTITVSRVNLSRAWRESATGAAAASDGLTKDNTSSALDKPKKQNTNMTKERKLVKMVSTISIMFLISYIPAVVMLIISHVDGDIQLSGLYTNLAYVMYSFVNLAETINSSINIFVYYSMSSRFKQEMKSMFTKSDRRIK